MTPGYEEEERKTPKAGYILLLFMFVAALFFGWRAIDDLKDVPQQPDRLAYCASPFITYDWQDYNRFDSQFRSSIRFAYPQSKDEICVFSSFEKKYGVPEIYNQWKTKNDELREVERKLSEVARQLSSSSQDYDIGLQEKIAREPKPIFPTPETKKDIIELREEQTQLTVQANKLKAEMEPLKNQLKEKYIQVMKDYRVAWRWYEFKVFLLEALFIIPFFWFVFWMYRKLLAKNSPYTIIFTALVGVASVLFLRILLVWLWSLFLARIIQTIWEFVQNFALLKSIVFYSGMILSIVVFGGAVYLLQKRIFDPRRVAIRRLREKQCPNCQTSLDLAGQFCPNCGRNIKKKCAKCGQDRWTDLPFCPHCKVS